MARRAASIWRAVRRPRTTALRPYSPKLTLLPTVATPLLRPFCSLRYFLLAGCSILRSRSCSGPRAGVRTPRRPLARFRRRGRHLCRLGVVGQDLALEHPDLDPDDAVRGARLREAVVDVGTQRVQRHATFAVPLAARDLDAV